MITPLATVLISGGAALIAAILTSWLGRMSSKEANEIDKFEAITNALEKRIESLERDLGKMKDALSSEQGDHEHTRTRLRISLHHIRETRSWLAGDRSEAPPQVPPELVAEL